MSGPTFGISSPGPGAGRGARWLKALHLDGALLVLIATIVAFGLFVLYSAAGDNTALWTRQWLRLGVAVLALLLLAQVPARFLRMLTPPAYVAGLLMLVAVELVGDVGKGAQRWLDLGLFRFQPSEMMKLVVPMMVAWYMADSTLPPTLKIIALSLLLIFIPVTLIAKQPDLGTSILIASSGIFVLLFSGIRWKIVFGFIVLVAASAPLLWYNLHDYQRSRVLTFLNPENDPLGAGYHIIQSKIAIGSGGLYGKGWLNGSQAHLEFLPERTTDFIFAVFCEEFGFLGILLLMSLYLFIIFRGLYIATQAQDTFTRLLAGSLILTFFVYTFVNISMVSGLLPVVGLPLPLISYGGTSMVTLMASFGILMSIHTHRKLLSG